MDSLNHLKSCLADEMVHVWSVPVASFEQELQDLCTILSPDEQYRAQRFYFPQDRAQFIVARAILRMLLASYLGREARSLRFDYGRRGKPELADSPTMKFNLSHSAGIVVYAFARSREIGIDVEHVRQDFAVEDIASRFFSSAEKATLLALAPEARCQAFYNCWTRKEAYIKALGEGLSLGLDAFDVSLAPGEPAALLAVRNSRACCRCSLRAFSPAPTYVGALAVAGSTAFEVSAWQWPDLPLPVN